MGSTSSKEQLLKSAIEERDLRKIQRLFRHLTVEQKSSLCKALVPNNDNRCTFLHYATWQDDESLLDYLLTYTDDLELRDGLGWTLLTTAIHRGSRENVHLLLNRGARVDCDGLYGMNLIATAMTFPDLDTIQMLLDHGARLTVPPEQWIDGRDPSGCYLLHFAVDRGVLDVVSYFLSKNQIPINAQNERGWTALHLAAGHDYLSIAKLLLDHGADVNIPDHHGNTPLAWARSIKADQMIQELKKHGARADGAWHGEQLKLCDPRGKHSSEKEMGAFENSHYEMEELQPDKSFISSDALQQRSLASPIL